MIVLDQYPKGSLVAAQCSEHGEDAAAVRRSGQYTAQMSRVGIRLDCVLCCVAAEDATTGHQAAVVKTRIWPAGQESGFISVIFRFKIFCDGPWIIFSFDRSDSRDATFY
jgi:hypothetical protein